MISYDKFSGAKEAKGEGKQGSQGTQGLAKAEGGQTQHYIRLQEITKVMIQYFILGKFGKTHRKPASPDLIQPSWVIWLVAQGCLGIIIRLRLSLEITAILLAVYLPF